MKLPLRIISDLHLGHRVSRITEISQLAPLLDGIGTLVVNGDVWQEISREFRDGSEQMLGELRALCTKRGVDLLLLPGNHDPGTGDPTWLELANGRILVTHGDAFYPDGAPWSRMAPLRKREVEALFANGMPATLRERLLFAREAARLLIPPVYPRGRSLACRVWEAITPPTRALRMLLVWNDMVRATALFAERYAKKAEIIIAGHFHRSGIWEQGKRLIINTGAFLPPGHPLAADWDGELLTVHRIREKDGAFQLSDRLGLWRV